MTLPTPPLGDEPIESSKTVRYRHLADIVTTIPARRGALRVCR
jgi:hypothetical protein